MTTKVLLDTDIDILGDIDDALCLAYLLHQPACELVGITTVTYDTEKRAMVASAMCKAAGKGVPIFAGASTPLLVPLPHFEASSAADDEDRVLRQWDHERSFPAGEAVEFMRRVIRDNPGEIVLLAVGPLTNIALLFSVDPEVPKLLKALVMMCGVFGNPAPGTGSNHRREWNAQVDPHAAAIVYRARAQIHRSVGLDVTERVKLDAPAFWREFRPATRHPLAAFAEAWFRHRPMITFHDPLAAVTLFDDVCGFAPGTVEVELAAGNMEGATYWRPGSAGARHEVALEVDPARFYEHYFGVFR